MQPFVAELITLPDNELYLMKVWLEDTAHTYVRRSAELMSEPGGAVHYGCRPEAVQPGAAAL